MSSANWWTDYFDAQYLLEYEPLFSPERDRAEVARLIDVLGLPSGARILDVPCGQGRHAHLLAEAGFDVDGFDYSAELLERARDRGTSSRLRYRRGDMRSLPQTWTGRFDAVVNLFTSFGFFAEPAHLQALTPPWLHFEILAMFLFIEVRSIAVARGRATGLGVTFLPITLAVILGTSLLLVRG